MGYQAWQTQTTLVCSDAVPSTVNQVVVNTIVDSEAEQEESEKELASSDSDSDYILCISYACRKK